MINKRIGILGGTFNPIHLGHIELMNVAKENFNLDEVWAIPTKIPPHKTTKNLVVAEHRINMCKICANKHNFKVLDIEQTMEGKSYSYRTLETLSKMYPKYEFVLICGTDMFVTLLDWKYPERIFKAAKIGGVFRAGGDFSQMEKLKKQYELLGANVEICYAEIADISSTVVRECVLKNEDASNFIDDEVYDYIKMNNLYKD